MSIFDPLYRPARGQHTFLARKQQTGRKRKRDDGEAHSSEDESDADVKSSSGVTPRTSSTAFNHPVNRTDPYHVAGHSRQDPLPPPPFPHAPLRERAEPRESVEEELAALNPPLYVPKAAPDDQSSSLKRRHVDNLTTLLHTCMLRGDWQRASRAWGLLLRTEIGGHGPDLRQQGRWGIGGELLIRRKADAPSSQLPDEGKHAGGAPTEFSDEGFRVARDYYERLILQYPHTPRTQHYVNALAFYPALFNIWVYEVQDRAKRRRRNAEAERPASSSSSMHSGTSGVTSPIARETEKSVRGQELAEALPIAQRMDELLVSPPYDSSAALLQLRGMVGLWVADLYAGTARSSLVEDEDSELDFKSPGDRRRDRRQANGERQKALGYLRRAEQAGVALPENIRQLLDGMDEDYSPWSDSN